MHTGVTIAGCIREVSCQGVLKKCSLMNIWKVSLHQVFDQGTCLLIAVSKVHEPVKVPVVVQVPGGVDGQHEVVDAQAIALSIGIGMNARVQQLVVGRQDACRQTEKISACRRQHQQDHAILHHMPALLCTAAAATYNR